MSEKDKNKKENNTNKESRENTENRSIENKINAGGGSKSSGSVENKNNTGGASNADDANNTKDTESVKSEERARKDSTEKVKNTKGSEGQERVGNAGNIKKGSNVDDYDEKLGDLLLATAKKNASDLHIAVGKRPTIRVDDVLVPLANESIVTKKDAEGLVMALLDEEQQQEFLKKKQLDFSYSFEDKARFRASVYMQRGFMAAALRLIPSRIKTIEELNLPPVLHDFAKMKQGFVLMVGPAGHGKSTTLAAILDEINHNRTEHIITVEDPIEYVFSQDRSIISQREVGRDALSFNTALRSVLRQDPDVIMIGEIRDSETMSTAMTSAETGHLVFSTLHTNSASQTIDRIIDSFPPNQQSQVASQLAGTLEAVVSERLIPRTGGGRIPAMEILLVNPAVRNLIREGKIYQIDMVIETSTQEGMISLNRSLAELVKRNEITMDNAISYSTNPSELRILLERT